MYTSLQTTPDTPATIATQLSFIAPTPQLPVYLPYGWWEPTCYQFRLLAAQFGIQVNTDRIHFCGFDQEGAGCSYEAEINIHQLLNSYKDHNRPSIPDTTPINLPEILIDPAILEQLQNGSIEAHGHVRSLKNKTRVYVAMQFTYPDFQPHDYRELDGEIEAFIDAVIALCDELNQVLFARLRQAYESLAFP